MKLIRSAALISLSLLAGFSPVHAQGQTAVIEPDTQSAVQKAVADYKMSEGAWIKDSVSLEDILKMDRSAAATKIHTIAGEREEADAKSVAMRVAMKNDSQKKLNDLRAGKGVTAKTDTLKQVGVDMGNFFDANIDRLNSEIEKLKKSPQANTAILLSVLRSQLENAENSRIAAKRLVSDASDPTSRKQGETAYTQLDSDLVELNLQLDAQIAQDRINDQLWQKYYTSWSEQAGGLKDKAPDPLLKFVGHWEPDARSIDACKDFTPAGSGRNSPATSEGHKVQLDFIIRDGDKTWGTITISSGGTVGGSPLQLEFPVDPTVIVQNVDLLSYDLRVQGQKLRGYAKVHLRFLSADDSADAQIDVEAADYGFPKDQNTCSVMIHKQPK